MRTAVIDLGTNTFKLLVASLTAEGGLKVEYEEELPVHLGKGGIEQSTITEDAFSRGLEALRYFTDLASTLGIHRVHGSGTSALRNSRNGEAFVKKAEELFGMDIVVVPGDEEAALILDGVRQAVHLGTKPWLIMDIGGGSIEFILATDKALMWKRSFELGTTRLCERFNVGDRMSTTDEFRLAAHIDARLEALWAVMDRHWPSMVVGSAGSFDTLAAIISAQRGLSLEGCDRLSFNDTEFAAVKGSLMGMSRTERRQVPGLPEHRVDTILPALCCIERVLVQGPHEVTWSRYALKEGAAWRALTGLSP